MGELIAANWNDRATVNGDGVLAAQDQLKKTLTNLIKFGAVASRAMSSKSNCRHR